MKKWLIGMLALCVTFVALGCGGAEKEARLADLDFTVMDETAVPEELRELIEERKGSAFKLTYSDSQFLYLVVGYGEQPTGGYSIQINDLYLTESSIYLDANLLGPKKGEAIAEKPSYPWIVVKMEYRQEKVVFDT